MQQNIHRDRHRVPALDALWGKNVDPVLEGAAAAYASLIASRAETITCVRELARPALDFRTWPLMTSRGLSDGEAARVLTRAFAGAA